MANATKRCHGSGSDKEFNASTEDNCVEDKELSATKSLGELLSQQTNKVKPDGSLLSQDESTDS